MASAWGNRIYTSTNSWQAGVTVEEVSRTDAAITYRVSGVVWTAGAFDVYAGGKVSDSTGGSASYSGALSQGANATTTYATYTRTVSRTYGAARSVTFTATYSVTGGYGNGTSTASVSVSVPAHPYSAPRPPKGATVETGGTQTQRVSWVADYDGSGGARPWLGVRVERQVDGGAWTQLAEVSATVTNWSDNSTEAGHTYAYRVRSYNSAGASAYVDAGSVTTTPVTPASVAVTRTGASTVGASVRVAMHSPAFEAQVSTDGKTWAEATVEYAEKDLGVTGGNMWSLTISTVPTADKVTYRVRTTAGDMSSGWRESNAIATLAAPLAPSVTVPAATVATGEACGVSWVPNHPDMSAQTAAQVEVTRPSGTKYTTSATTAASANVTPTAAGTWSVRVRTKGLHASWGAWSGPAEFEAAARPTVNITTPIGGATVTALPYALAFASSDATGVVEQTVRVLSASGETLHEAWVSASATGYTLGPDTYMLSNRTKYSIEVGARGGSGLASVARAAISTAWTAPARPTATVEYDGAMRATVTVAAGSESGAPATVSLTVSRVLADGTSTPIGGTLAPGASVADPMPPIGVAYGYVLTAYAQSGATETATVPAETPAKVAVLGFGQGAERAVVGEYDPDVSGSMSRDVSLLSMAGRTHPVAYSTDQRSETERVAFTVVGDDAALSMIARCREDYDGWLRDPIGNRHRVSVAWAWKRRSPEVWDFTATCTVLDWEEPVNG